MSEVDICNLTLTQLGEERIVSRTENSENARRLNAIFDEMRDAMLRLHPWNFAVDRVALAQLSDTPVIGYDYYHQLPGNCLRVIAVNDGTNAITDYKIEGRKLLSDYDTVYIKYIKREEDPQKFDNAFAIAFAARLAAELAFAITEDKTVIKSAWDIYELKLDEAKSADAQESSSLETEGKDEWLEERI